MRRLSLYLLTVCCLSTALVAQGATGKIIKVLPLFLDQQGRDSVSPSLYERDAYQVYLRDHPDKRSGLRFAVQWKAKGPTWETLKIRVEIKGTAEGSLPKEKTLEKVVTPGGWFSHWTKLFLTGEDYRELVEVTAWRATLWEGDKLLGEEKSFLW